MTLKCHIAWFLFFITRFGKYLTRSFVQLSETILDEIYDNNMK